MKMTDNDNKVINNQKESPLGMEYAQSFTETTQTNTKFNIIKAYICYKTETTLPYKTFLYNNDD